MKIYSQPKEYWSKEACDLRYKCDEPDAEISNGKTLEPMDLGDEDDIMESNMDLEDKMEALEALDYAEQAEKDANEVWEQSRGTSNLK